MAGALCFLRPKVRRKFSGASIAHMPHIDIQILAVCRMFNNNTNNNNNNNNTLFKYIYVHKHDTRYIFEKEDREVIPIKGPSVSINLHPLF